MLLSLQTEPSSILHTVDGWDQVTEQKWRESALFSSAYKRSFSSYCTFWPAVCSREPVTSLLSLHFASTQKQFNIYMFIFPLKKLRACEEFQTGVVVKFTACEKPLNEPVEVACPRDIAAEEWDWFHQSHGVATALPYPPPSQAQAHTCTHHGTGRRTARSTQLSQVFWQGGQPDLDYSTA